ncbi:hypothetical protein Ddc_16916 [Ditylenchus destructor]|nr:hypothetical protein Ddc_16916 [Ditylenchus destructor]
MALSKVNFMLFLLSLVGIFTSVKAGIGWRVEDNINGERSVNFYDSSLNHVGGYSDSDLVNYASSRRSGSYYNNGYNNNYYGNGYGNYYGNVINAIGNTWTVHISGQHNKTITTLGASGKEIRDAVKNLLQEYKNDVITIKKGSDANTDSIMPNDKKHDHTELFVVMKEYLTKVYDTRKDSNGNAQRKHLGDVSLPKVATGKYILDKVQNSSKYSWAVLLGAFCRGKNDALKNIVHIAKNQNYDEEISTEGVDLYAS